MAPPVEQAKEVRVLIMDFDMSRLGAEEVAYIVKAEVQSDLVLLLIRLLRLYRTCEID